MIEINRLSCSFQGRPILSDVCLSIPTGRHVAVVGPNGVGKTTFLRCLDMLLTDWTGEILIGGRSVRSIARKELARKIAFVQQIPPVFFSQTVRQLVSLGRYPRLNPLTPLSEHDEAMIAESLRRTRTEELAERNVETLSGGERQRVLLAAALAQEPEILLLDEPASFLDCRHQEEMARLLTRINRQSGITIIEVTHDLNRAALLDAQAVALVRGSIFYDGPIRGMMTAAKLEEIFGVKMPLAPHPKNGVPMVLPQVSETDLSDSEKNAL